MSKIIINPYRVLKQTTVNTIFSGDNCIEMRYFYKSLKNKKEYELIQKGESSNNLYLDDPNYEWNPQNQKLFCKISIQVNSVSSLFSPLIGIATPLSKLGIAVIWRCKESKTRGTINLEDIEITENLIASNLNSEFSIKPKMLIGKINFKFMIYLKEFTPCDNRFGFANKPGTILGLINSKDIYIDGNGSMFPIMDEDINSDLLWRDEICFEDFDETFDDDSFCLYFNKNHSNYADLVSTHNKNKHSQLFKEVLAQAIFDLIEYARDKDDKFMQTITGVYDDGSIAKQLKFFINVCQWNLESPYQSLKSIRKYIEEKF